MRLQLMAVSKYYTALRDKVYTLHLGQTIDRVESTVYGKANYRSNVRHVKVYDSTAEKYRKELTYEEIDGKEYVEFNESKLMLDVMADGNVWITDKTKQ